MRKVNVSAWRDGSLLKNGASLLMVCLLIFSILKISDARFMVKIWDKMYGVDVFKSRRSEVLCRWVVAVRLAEAAFYLFSIVFFVAAHPGREEILLCLSSF